MLCPQKNLSSSKKKKRGRIFPGVTKKHAYNQTLAENNSKCQAKKKRRGERRRSTDTDGGIVDSNFIPNLSFSGRKPAAP